MAHLIFTGECKADFKGRVTLPRGLKKELAPVLNDGFVLKKNAFHRCLDLFPKAEWETEIIDVLKLNRYIRKNDEYVRRFMAGVRTVELDANGRLLIPKDLLAYANIKKELVVASQVNKVEIWDKESYRQVVEESETDFGDLSEDVMGSMDKE